MTSRPPYPRLRRVEPILRRSLREECRLHRGSHVLVAASGGADSTALLIGLHRIAPELDLALSAAHLHHGVRGADADEDLAFVRDLCRRLAVPLEAARWDCPARMERLGLSGEQGLRVLRRRFLRAAAVRAGARWIATGHTADDLTETLLMRLGRGAGLPGLGGIAPRRGPWIRPLLGAPKAVVTGDLERGGIPWREDLTNRDARHLRNRIRHQVMLSWAEALGATTVRAAGSLAVRVAAGTAEVRSARRILARWAERRLARVCRHEGAEVTLDSRRWGSYPLALRRALFRQLWKRIAPDSTGLTRRHLEALDGLVATARGSARLQLPCGVLAERARGSLRVRRPGPST